MVPIKALDRSFQIPSSKNPSHKPTPTPETSNQTNGGGPVVFTETEDGNTKTVILTGNSVTTLVQNQSGTPTPTPTPSSPETSEQTGAVSPVATPTPVASPISAPTPTPTPRQTIPTIQTQFPTETPLVTQTSSEVLVNGKGASQVQVVVGNETLGGRTTPVIVQLGSGRVSTKKGVTTIVLPQGWTQEQIQVTNKGGSATYSPTSGPSATVSANQSLTISGGGGGEDGTSTTQISVSPSESNSNGSGASGQGSFTRPAASMPGLPSGGIPTTTVGQSPAAQLLKVRIIQE